MKKIEKEYVEKYGDIPDTTTGRIDYLVSKLKAKKRYRRKNIIDEIRRIMKLSWSKYHFTIYLVPKATPRPRANFQSNIFYVTGSKINKELFSKFIEEYPKDMITTPIKLYVNSYLPTPSTMKLEDMILAELGYIRPQTKPDCDNVLKTYADMMEGTLLYDDALVIKEVSEKFYSIKPRVDITIEYMDDYDCLYNKSKIKEEKKGSH